MRHLEYTRRSFLRKSAGITAAGIAAPYIFTSSDLRADEPKSKNDRPVFGCIGLGDMSFRYPWKEITDSVNADKFGTVAAVCDVDRNRAEEASDSGKRAVFHDYRKLLDRKDIEAVTISTPDHWHTKIAIDAMRAGKDVFCQKPLTLTIDEGKKICKVVKETGCVFQVGTQQRSTSELFLTAVAMCHLGAIGKIQRVTCAVGGRAPGGPFEKATPPQELDWEMWQGQAPKTEYIKERTHSTFRGWYEYAGGEITDWGAHHVDIAQWAIGMDRSGPLWVEGTAAHPIPLKDGRPTRDDRYNTATSFLIRAVFPGDVEMVIRSDTDNGILFEGTEGRFFVNREKMAGAPVEDLAANPLPEDAINQVYGGEIPEWHMGNFLECVKTRRLPISDVYSHHRALTTCHLANIAIRLGRRVNWDAENEQIVGDREAQSWQAREQRKGYEIED